MSASSEAPVSLHKVVARHAVLIGEDQVVGGRSLDSLVENLGFSEAHILVPYMPDWQYGSVFLYKTARAVVGAVIGDDDFVGADSLRHIAPQRFLEPPRIVVCRYDYACSEVVHGGCCFLSVQM